MEKRWVRNSDNFRADLQRLYKLGYQPISLRDYVSNNINTSAGKSPVIFTFDDGTLGQFNYVDAKGGPKIDPNCAVAIMDKFHGEHPDWPLEATFYVYYPVPFRQKEFVADKLRRIVELGMDIGNHTYTHTRLDLESDAGAARELALSVKSAQAHAPGAIVDSIALPYGKGPKNKSLLRSGEHDGVKYHNIAALLVGAEPAPSPVSPKFDPYRLPRVQAIQSELDMWLGYLEKHPEDRYISDGEPDTVTVPRELADGVAKERLGKKALRVY
jgi:peptidoglycan/xylan/chitin deacetylase (PgdA/CDA1 family)